MMTNQTTHRPLRDDADVQRIRALLAESVCLGPPGLNWDVRQWDGWRWYDEDVRWNPAWQEQVHLWEADGTLLGAAMRAGQNLAALHVHPAHRESEPEMLAWAEGALAGRREDGMHVLGLNALDGDEARLTLLRARGYEELPYASILRRHPLAEIAPRRPLADGYTLRTTRAEDADGQRIADLLNAAFQRDFHNAAEWVSFTRHAPCFRADLDLVAVAPDGSFAAYVGIPYDDANRRGIFEPVCTHPAHQRRGLARTLMIEGLHRLRALGAAGATVETGEGMAANRLYAAVGFELAARIPVWKRTWPPESRA